MEHLGVWVGFSATCLFVSCAPSMPPEPSELAGYYVFQYPAGHVLQVEMLTVNVDFTFHQEFYSTETAFRMGDRPDNENDGTWSLKGDELRFDDWLSYCGRSPAAELDPPIHCIMLNVFWRPPADDHDALIDVWSESGYVFQRVPPPTEK